MMTVYSQLRKEGPFPGQIDPWAEAGRYFQQIQDPLEALGYIAGRETSLQIAERREPDIYVRRAAEQPQYRGKSWDYPLAAVEVLAEAGVAMDFTQPDLQGVFIKREGGELITIVEVISPRNKTDQNVIHEYQNRRERLLEKGINIVEIDLTRSVKRLVEDTLATTYAYHVAVYLPDQAPRFIGIDYGEMLKRVALPLRAQVIPLELQPAYDYAYQVARIAIHIEDETGYSEDALPFRSLLLETQYQQALKAVKIWKERLAQLRG